MKNETSTTVYAGLFLIALSSLAIQIILVRLLSVITWYHLAFFSISTASLKDIEHLRYDVTNIGNYLNRQGKACVIGVGGGKDIQSALLFGHTSVLGIEVNPIFINLHAASYRKIVNNFPSSRWP